MIRDHAWFGVGRGAFETAFPPYRQVLDRDWTAVYGHAENFVVEWLAEWGIPIGLCAIVAVAGYVLREWYGARNSRLQFMVLAGLAALLLQNFADLGLEIPAVAIAAVLALAAGERPAARAAVSKSPGAGVFAAAVPLLAVLTAACLWSRWPVEDERREIEQNYRHLSLTSAEARRLFRGQLRSAMLRHPGESFFPLLGSLVAYRARDGSPLPWIARSLEVAPTNGRVHLMLAELLGTHKLIGQAMLHLRLATEYDATLRWIAGARAAEWAPSVAVLLQAIPNGEMGDSMLDIACAATRPELRLDCFRQAAARSPGEATASGQLADLLLGRCRLARGHATAQPPRVARTKSTVRRARWPSSTPNHGAPGYLIAKVLLARGDTKGAAALLANVCPTDIDGQECAREAVNATIKSGSDEAVVAAADGYAARACENGASCAEALEWVGTTLEHNGKLLLAVNYYRKAADVDGSAARWLRVADRSIQAGLLSSARVAVERADQSPDATENSRAHTELLRRRIARTSAGSL